MLLQLYFKLENCSSPALRAPCPMPWIQKQIPISASVGHQAIATVLHPIKNTHVARMRSIHSGNISHSIPAGMVQSKTQRFYLTMFFMLAYDNQNRAASNI